MEQVADQNQYPEKPRNFDADQARDMFTPPEDADLQWVLVPVTHTDHARRRRRMYMLAGAFLAVAAIFASWMYKRTVDPVRALDEYDAGERSLKIARYQQAIVSFDRAIALKSDFADAYALRGRANMALIRAQAALPDFDKVVELRPLDPVAFLDRGSAHMSLDEYKEALADFSRAIELDPKLARGYNLRGTALRAMGEPKKALEDFTKAVDLDPNMDNLFQRGATYQLLNDHEFAIADFSQVIRLDQNSAQGYYARSQSFKALGDLESAERDHQQGRINDGR